MIRRSTPPVRQPVITGSESVFLPQRIEPKKPAAARPEVVFDGRMKTPFQRSISSPATFSVSGETCGLLLGRVLTGGHIRVLVEGYHSVPADAARGGAPHFSLLHERVLEQTIARYMHEPSVKVLGMYRTSRAGELAMSPQDFDLFHRYFQDPLSIYLMLRPLSFDTSVGALYWRELPEDPDVLPTEVMIEATGEYVSSYHRRASGREWLRRGSQVLLVAAGLLVPLAWIAWDANIDAREAAIIAEGNKAANVQLEIMRAGSDLLISWKRAGENAAPLVSGRLTIVDSDYRKEFVLDKQQLASGRMVYQPITSDVNVSLRATTEDNKTVSDTLRAYYPAVAEPPKPLTELLRPTLEPQATLPTQNVVEVRSPASAVTERLVAKNAVEEEEEAEAEPTERARNYRTLQLPSRSPRAVSNIPLAEAPDLQVDLFSSIKDAVKTTPVAREILPAWERRAEQGSNAPSVLRQPKIVAATATKTVQPSITSSIRQRIQRPTVVSIVANVNEQGRVTSATPQTRHGGWEGQLVMAARAAVSQWRFKPSMIDGRPVPGQVIINFTFTP